MPEDGTNNPPGAADLKNDPNVNYQSDPSATEYQPNRGNIFDNAGLTTIHAIASLLMWFKLIYFLRIFESTGKSLTLEISNSFILEFRLLGEDAD